MASADHRSAADIEREIEEERSALARTLDEIHDRLSFEALSSDLMGRVRVGGGDIGRSLARTARDNPIPFALTAIGLAWLLAGRYSHTDEAEEDPYFRAAATPASVRWAQDNRRDRDTSVDPLPAYGDTRGEARWDRARGAYSGAREAGAEAGHNLREGVRSGREQFAARAHSAGEHIRAGLDSAGEAAGAGAAGVRHYISDTSRAIRRRARGAYASAGELRHRIAEGTEELSSTARKRVIEARTRAYEAQLRAEHYAARQRERASDLFEEQPLVAGALAVAVGAAIGGLLPRTRREDDAVGSYRDQLFEEAERVYKDERSRLESVVRETAREARSAASDLADDVKSDVEKTAQRTADAARAKLAETETKAREAAERVTEKARREAQKHSHD